MDGKLPGSQKYREVTDVRSKISVEATCQERKSCPKGLRHLLYRLGYAVSYDWQHSDLRTAQNVVEHPRVVARHAASNGTYRRCRSIVQRSRRYIQGVSSNRILLHSAMVRQRLQYEVMQLWMVDVTTNQTWTVALHLGSSGCVGGNKCSQNNANNVAVNIQGVTGGTGQTSGGCSLC